MREICIDSRMAFHSGIGTYIRNLLPYFKNAFTGLRVIAPTQLMNEWPELQRYDLIPIKAPLYSIHEQLELPFLIPSCDVYISPHYNIPLFPIRAKKRVTTIHDVCHLAYQDSLSWIKRCYAKIMIKSAATLSDHVITGSRFSRDEIIKHTKIDPSKISSIHYGVNQQLFSSISTQISHPLPENFFLFVSTLSPHKNVTRLLRAWHCVIQKYPDWQLVLAGKAVKNKDYLQVFDEYSNLREHVKFLGFVDDQQLLHIYQKAKAMIYPSLYEGFGLPPLEAMAAGCPTMVSTAASIPEICGDASLYFNPLNEEDIAQKMCSLIETPSLRHSLIDRGKERIDQFSWEKTAKEHIEVIESILRCK